MAAGLLALGVQKGDRVGLWGVNSPEWVLSHAGGLRAGGMVVNLHPGYRPREIEYTLNKVSTRSSHANANHSTITTHQYLS